MRHPKDERARRLPDGAVLESPCVGQGSVPDTLDQPGRSQLMSRPLVELLQPRSDDPEIQESSEAELAIEDGPDAVTEGVLVGQDPGQLQEDPGHAEPRVTDERCQRAQPSQRDSGRGDERVCIEHAAEHDVHEEALGCVLRLRHVAVLEVRGDHAPVVRPIPGTSGRAIDERHPVVDRARRARTRKAPAERHCFAAVPNDALVDGTPPRTPRTVGERRLQHTSPELPAHERQRRSAIGKMSGRSAERAVIAPLHQAQSTRGVVANGPDDLLRPRCGAGADAHLARQGDVRTSGGRGSR